MPRRRTVTTIEEDNANSPVNSPELEPGDGPEDLPELSPEEAEEQKKIKDVCRSLQGTGATVQVYAKKKSGLGFALLDSMPVEDFILNGPEEIRRKYGGGEYQLKCKDSGGIIRGNSTLSVDARLKGEIDQPPAPTADPTKLLEQFDTRRNSDLSNLMVQMMNLQMQQAAQQQQQMTQLLTALVAQPKTGGLADITKLATPLVPVFIELIKGRSVDQTQKTIELLSQAKGLFGDGGSDRGGAVEQLISAIGPMLAAKMANAPAQVMVDTGAPTAPAPSNVVQLNNPQLPAPSPDTDPNNPEMIKALILAAIRQQYPKLCRAADKGSDAVSYANVLIDDIEEAPEQILKDLFAILERDTWAKELFGVDQLDHPEWFGQLRSELLDWWKEANEAQKEEQPAPKVAGGKK